MSVPREKALEPALELCVVDGFMNERVLQAGVAAHSLRQTPQLVRRLRALHARQCFTKPATDLAIVLEPFLAHFLQGVEHPAGNYGNQHMNRADRANICGLLLMKPEKFVDGESRPICLFS